MAWSADDVVTEQDLRRRGANVARFAYYRPETLEAKFRDRFYPALDNRIVDIVQD